MANFSHSPFESTLEIVATLRDTSILASVKDRLTYGPAEYAALMTSVTRAYRSGVNVSALSDASGLTVDQIVKASADADLIEMV